MNTEVKKTLAAITVDHVQPHKYKGDKGIDSAQLRQIMTTTYPSVRIGNSKSDGLFNQEDFKLLEGKSYTSTRVTWINAPSGTTVQQIQELLASKPNACIYRTISFRIEDVLTDEQKQAISAGLRSVEEFKDQLRVRRQNEAGQVVEIDGPPQYRQYFFSTVAKEDEDYRGDDAPMDNENDVTVAENAVKEVATTPVTATAELVL